MFSVTTPATSSSVPIDSTPTQALPSMSESSPVQSTPKRSGSSVITRLPTFPDDIARALNANSSDIMNCRRDRGRILQVLADSLRAKSGGRWVSHMHWRCHMPIVVFDASEFYNNLIHCYYLSIIISLLLSIILNQVCTERGCPNVVFNAGNDASMSGGQDPHWPKYNKICKLDPNKMFGLWASTLFSQVCHLGKGASPCHIELVINLVLCDFLLSIHGSKV